MSEEHGLVGPLVGVQLSVEDLAGLLRSRNTERGVAMELRIAKVGPDNYALNVHATSVDAQGRQTSDAKAMLAVSGILAHGQLAAITSDFFGFARRVIDVAEEAAQAADIEARANSRGDA